MDAVVVFALLFSFGASAAFQCSPLLDAIGEPDTAQRTNKVVAAYREMLAALNETQALTLSEYEALVKDPFTWLATSANRAEARALLGAMANAVEKWDEPKRLELVEKLTAVVRERAGNTVKREADREQARTTSAPFEPPLAEVPADMNLKKFWFLPDARYLATNGHRYVTGALDGSRFPPAFRELGFQLYPELSRGKYALKLATGLEHAPEAEVRWIDLETMRPLDTGWGAVSATLPFPAHEIKNYARSVSSAAFTGDGLWLVMQLTNHTLATRRLSTGEMGPPYSEPVLRIAAMPKGTGTVWLVNENRFLVPFSIDGSPAKPTKYGFRKVGQVGVSEDGSEIVVQGQPAGTGVDSWQGYDAKSGASLWATPMPPPVENHEHASSGKLSRNGKYYARVGASGEHSMVEIFATRTGKRLGIGHLRGKFNRVDFDQDTTRVAFFGPGTGTTLDGKVLVFDLARWLETRNVGWNGPR